MEEERMRMKKMMTMLDTAIRNLLPVIGAFALLLSACDKKQEGGEKEEKSAKKAPDAAGATTAPEAARGFLQAVAARDQNAAAKYLMNMKVCNSFPEEKRKGCPEYVTEIRKQLPAFMESVPKSFKPGRVNVKQPPGGPKGSKMVSVLPEGEGRPITLMAIKLKGRFYVGMGIKKKAIPKKLPENKGTETKGEKTGSATGAELKDEATGSENIETKETKQEAARPRRSARPARPAKSLSTRPARPARPADTK
jgi:hypothetical protein